MSAAVEEDEDDAVAMEAAEEAVAAAAADAEAEVAPDVADADVVVTTGTEAEAATGVEAAVTEAEAATGVEAPAEAPADAAVATAPSSSAPATPPPSHSTVAAAATAPASSSSAPAVSPSSSAPATTPASAGERVRRYYEPLVTQASWVWLLKMLWWALLALLWFVVELVVVVVGLVLCWTCCGAGLLVWSLSVARGAMAAHFRRAAGAFDRERLEAPSALFAALHVSYRFTTEPTLPVAAEATQVAQLGLPPPRRTRADRLRAMVRDGSTWAALAWVLVVDVVLSFPSAVLIVSALGLVLELLAMPVLHAFGAEPEVFGPGQPLGGVGWAWAACVLGMLLAPLPLHLNERLLFVLARLRLLFGRDANCLPRAFPGLRHCRDCGSARIDEDTDGSGATAALRLRQRIRKRTAAARAKRGGTLPTVVVHDDDDGDDDDVGDGDDERALRRRAVLHASVSTPLMMTERRGGDDGGGGGGGDTAAAVVSPSAAAAASPAASAASPGAPSTPVIWGTPLRPRPRRTLVQKVQAQQLPSAATLVGLMLLTLLVVIGVSLAMKYTSEALPSGLPQLLTVLFVAVLLAACGVICFEFFLLWVVVFTEPQVEMQQRKRRGAAVDDDDDDDDDLTVVSRGADDDDEEEEEEEDGVDAAKAATTAGSDDDDDDGGHSDSGDGETEGDREMTAGGAGGATTPTTGDDDNGMLAPSPARRSARSASGQLRRRHARTRSGSRLGRDLGVTVGHVGAVALNFRTVRDSVAVARNRDDRMEFLQMLYEDRVLDDVMLLSREAYAGLRRGTLELAALAMRGDRDAVEAASWELFSRITDRRELDVGLVMLRSMAGRGANVGVAIAVAEACVEAHARVARGVDAGTGGDDAGTVPNAGAVPDAGAVPADAAQVQLEEIV